MPRTTVSEGEAVQAFADMVNTDFLREPKSLGHVISRMVDFYESVAVTGADDQLLLVTNMLDLQIPKTENNGFFDTRKEDISWERASDEKHQLFQIRRYIQLDRGESDTSLDCKLYFTPLNSVQLAPRAGAYTEFCGHDQTHLNVDRFLQNPAVAPLLNKIPDYLFGFATIVW